MEKLFPSPSPYLSGLGHFCSLRTVLPTSVLASSPTAILHRNQSYPVKISEIMSLHYQKHSPNTSSCSEKSKSSRWPANAYGPGYISDPVSASLPTSYSSHAGLLALESSRHMLIFNSLPLSPLPGTLYDGPSGKLLRNYMSSKVWH